MGLADDPAHERVHGEGERHVEDERGEERRHERMAGDDVLVQEVVEDVAECGHEHGDRPDGDDRREPSVTPGRLCVAPGPEPREREDQRGHAERSQCDEVDDHAADETEHGTGNRASEESERDHDDEQKVRRATRDDERRHDDDLQQRGDEHHGECAQRVDGRHQPRSVGTSTRTASSAPKSTYGSIWTCW